MSWTILSLLSAFLWAIGNIIDKIILTKWPIHPLLPVLIIGLVDLIVSTGIFVFHDVPLLPPPLLLLAFLAGACYFFMLYLYFYAVKWEEITRVIPLLYLTPLWIALIAYLFLDETLQSKQYYGIALLVLGAILISVRTFQAPRLNKALLGLVLSCLCLAFNQVITKYLLDYVDVASTFAYVRASAFLAMLPLLLVKLKLFSSVYQKNGSLPIILMIGNAGLNLAGLFILIIALQVGYVTLINALIAVQPFFVLLFAFLLCRFYPSILEESLERISYLKKILAIVIMFSGAILIQ